jgi:general secretion pathway protein G
MQKGFTVIELIIVVVVIGILAAIAIVGYSGSQKKAYDTTVQSDLDSMSGELEGYRARVDTANPNQRFPSSTTNLDTLEIQTAKAGYDTTIPYNLIYCLSTTGTDAYQAYKLIAQSKSGRIFVMTQDGFVANSLTTANLTTGLCATQSMGLQLNGMTTGGTWASWTHAS